ncbi:hypothetical protein GCM10023201_06630 [Actinomycetospora corticicola]|uniref:Uncharacterized protein n=1 Tax=Actinomycetospora corticicola TaxID=663602 RepID=A0A7Y9J429_9PSEU|nr:hypothetical protein [Actinomycetospora corticicola]NYD34688.1 hypothetical protein [Actinomycetospora corticicola]
MAGSCSRCGAPRTDDWAFCRSCGAVDVPAPRQAPQEAARPTPARATAAARPAAAAAEDEPGSELIPTVGPRSGPLPSPGPRSGPLPASAPRSGPLPASAPGSGPRSASAPASTPGSGPLPAAPDRAAAPSTPPRAVPRPRRPEGEGRPAAWPTIEPARRPGPSTPHSGRVRVPLHDTPGAGVPRGPASVARPSVRVGSVGSVADWAHAALAALVVLVVLALPGAVLAVTLGADAAGGSPLLLLPVAVALGVSGSVGITVAPLGLGVTVAATPLLVTGAAVLAGAGLVVGRSRPGPEVPVQAVRALVLFLGGLAAVALLGRAAPGDGRLTVAIAPTLLGGAAWFGGALVLAVAWRRPDALPAALRPVRDLLAGPVAGLGAILGACWLVGLALVVAGALARSGAPVPSAATAGEAFSGTSPVAAVLLVVVFAPSALLVAFAVGLGVPLTPRTPFGDGELGLVRLLGEGPSWWLAPLVAGVVCVLGGMVAALHAPDPDAAARRGWALGPALAVLLAAAVPATSAVVGPFGLHLDLATGVVLGLAWGAVGGLLGAVVAPGLPPALRGGRLGAGSTTAGQVVGVTVVVLFLSAALVVGFITAARLG